MLINNGTTIISISGILSFDMKFCSFNYYVNYACGCKDECIPAQQGRGFFLKPYPAWPVSNFLRLFSSRHYFKR